MRLPSVEEDFIAVRPVIRAPLGSPGVFDYDGSGKQDHLVLYRPDTGTIWILKREQ